MTCERFIAGDTGFQSMTGSVWAGLHLLSDWMLSVHTGPHPPWAQESVEVESSSPPCMCPRTQYVGAAWFMGLTDSVTYSQSCFSTLVSSTGVMYWTEGPAVGRPAAAFLQALGQGNTVAKWNFSSRKALGSSLQSWLPSLGLLCDSSMCSSPCPCLSLPAWSLLGLWWPWAPDWSQGKGQSNRHVRGIELEAPQEVIVSIFSSGSSIHSVSPCWCRFCAKQRSRHQVYSSACRHGSCPMELRVRCLYIPATVILRVTEILQNFYVFGALSPKPVHFNFEQLWKSKNSSVDWVKVLPYCNFHIFCLSLF